jgi:hypothetical protein
MNAIFVTVNQGTARQVVVRQHIEVIRKKSGRDIVFEHHNVGVVYGAIRMVSVEDRCNIVWVIMIDRKWQVKSLYCHSERE